MYQLVTIEKYIHIQAVAERLTVNFWLNLSHLCLNGLVENSLTVIHSTSLRNLCFTVLGI